MADDGDTAQLLKPGERPTLKTIARITGLAVATVSRALNDAPDIGQNTKRRVQDCATQIGYRPNRAGVRLRTGKTNVISLVMSTEHDLMNHTARLLNSVAGGLRGSPYHLIVTPFFPDQDPLSPIRYVVETHSADAVIFNQIEPDDARVRYLMDRRFPFATHGRSDLAARHAYFDFDNTGFVRGAVDMLAKRGRKNIILIAPPLSQNYAQNMAEGLILGGERHAGVAQRLLATATSDSTASQIRQAVGEQLDSDPTIDGIISGSTNAAMASVAAIEERGLKLGSDVDVVGKEAIPFLNAFRPELLVVSEDVTRAGQFLARAVMQQIENPDLPPMQELETPLFPGLGPDWS